jgi:hypothetical protein
MDIGAFLSTIRGSSGGDWGKSFAIPIGTAKQEPRASAALRRLETLRINTGTLCNITCRNWYIESSPSNHRLVDITAAEAALLGRDCAAWPRHARNRVQRW